MILRNRNFSRFESSIKAFTPAKSVKKQTNNNIFNKLKRRYTAFFLLICLALPPAAVYTYLKIQKKHIRKEVKKQIISGISKRELVLLSFSKEESKKRLSWKHAKEFAYKEVMYDIVESRSTSDSVFYWCWPDHKESRLDKYLTKLAGLALNKNQQRNDQQQKLTRFLNSLFFESFFSWHSCTYTSEIVFARYIVREYLRFIFPPIPPPPEQG